MAPSPWARCPNASQDHRRAQSCVLPESRPSLTSLPIHTHLGLEVTLPQLGSCP